jgi:hypothetical protein
MLSTICDAFQAEVEQLDSGADDYSYQLRPLVLKLVRDAAAVVEESHYGEVPALLELGRLVLAWLKSEMEDTEDRQRRYARRQAVLDLLRLCDGISGFYASKRKASDVAAHRARIGDALRGLVPAEQN